MATDRPQITPEQLERAAASLQATEFQVLALSAGESLSNAEVATQLGITPAAVERLLADALCKLDRALALQARLSDRPR